MQQGISLVYQRKHLDSRQNNEHLPSHDLCLGKNVMMQDPTSKRWSPVVINKLCKEPRSYQVTTKDGVNLQKDAISYETI